MGERVDNQYVRQGAPRKKSPTYQPQTKKLRIFPGLLVARTVAPDNEKPYNHWKTVDEGAIPRGRFGSFITRDRFKHIARNLRLSDNADSGVVTDRGWKLGSIIEALKATFRASYYPLLSWRSKRPSNRHCHRSTECVCLLRPSRTNMELNSSYWAAPSQRIAFDES
ncbi:Hypothetical protein PHPALM_819 [Phytophthora palmivora]|uniref:PiggyBac transposable element-derived protein domain-containing protein n=1 Tax=Phytophthora palmivora TaxID=4796 RepID=A0A2P4YTW7_9STRA|nr:Hypothetical protein PHPALM_819 [Phytophthora palmivora]